MTTLREALKSQDFALTAKLSMAPGQSAHDLVQDARLLATAVDAIQVPDNAHARPHISSIAAAALITREGIDPVIHMNCRDRNRVAVQSDLLGAQALGVSNVLLMRGNSLPADHLPRTTNVFDLSAIDLVATAAAIRDNVALAGGKLPDGPELYVGAVATAFRPNDDWQPEKLLTKADAGAQFIQLQVCMDAKIIEAYAAKLVAAKLTWRFQVLAALAVFESGDAARAWKKKRPDAVIPRTVIDRLDNADNPQQEGIAICAELLAALKKIPGIAGADLNTSGETAAILTAIDTSGVRGA